MVLHSTMYIVCTCTIYLMYKDLLIDIFGVGWFKNENHWQKYEKISLRVSYVTLKAIDQFSKLLQQIVFTVK